MRLTGGAELVADAVPEMTDCLEFENVNRPFRGREFSGMDEIERAVAAYIDRDLQFRDGGRNSETLGLFLGVLGVYMELGRILSLEALTPESRSIVTGWWHGFLSFVCSGPPAHRLRELLALHDAGLVRILGQGSEVGTDEGRGFFTAVSSQSPVTVSARTLAEARLAPASLATATEPLLRQLQADGTAVQGPAGSERMLVDREQRVVGSDRLPAERPFAVGAGTAGWKQGALARFVLARLEPDPVTLTHLAFIEEFPPLFRLGVPALSMSHCSLRRHGARGRAPPKAVTAGS